MLNLDGELVYKCHLTRAEIYSIAAARMKAHRKNFYFLDFKSFLREVVDDRYFSFYDNKTTAEFIDDLCKKGIIRKVPPTNPRPDMKEVDYLYEFVDKSEKVSPTIPQIPLAL